MRIFLIGAGPMPSENEGVRNAAGLRTSQFFHAAEQAGAEIFFVEISAGKNAKRKSTKPTACGKNFYLRLAKDERGLKKNLRKHLLEFAPHALVGVNFFPSFLAGKVFQSLREKQKEQIAFWADLNGWAMAETQGQARVLQSNAFLPHIWQMEKTVLANADRISTVSTRQQFATLGELAAIGRLSAENFGHDFVCAIANCMGQFESDKIRPGQKEIFRGRGKVKHHDFVVGHIGGFNSWVDWQTMFEALENAIKQNPHIHFATTGGALKNIDEQTFANFKNAAENSPFKDHFHFLGWVENWEIPQIYRECDCILNVDFACAETWCGARNRLTESLKFAKAIVTTIGCEISGKIAQAGAGLGAPNQDSRKITEHLLRLASNESLKEQIEKKSGELFAKEFSLESSKQMEPFRLWLQDPRKAPAGTLLNLEPSTLGKIKAAFTFLRTRGLRAALRKMF